MGVLGNFIHYVFVRSEESIVDYVGFCRVFFILCMKVIFIIINIWAGWVLVKFLLTEY